MFNLILQLILLLCNLIWFLTNFTLFLIHYLFILIIVSFCISKFFKLKAPVIPKSLESNKNYCFAHFGANFDVPENSRASIEYIISKKCSRVLLPLNLTRDGELVILDKSTLELENIHLDISKLSLDDLKNFNISKNHPLGAYYGSQSILTLDCLIKIVEPLGDEFLVILHVKRADNIFIEKLNQAIKNKPMFTKKIILCFNSPIPIYKIRKHHPLLMCAIWMESLDQWRGNKLLYRLIHIARSCYDIALRNLISPIIGNILIFIHKDEFNK